MPPGKREMLSKALILPKQDPESKVDLNQWDTSTPWYEGALGEADMPGLKTLKLIRLTCHTSS
jgi:hypothetical protein